MTERSYKALAALFFDPPDEPDAERDWIEQMIALEEQRGELPPGGATGGVAAAHRRRERERMAPYRDHGNGD